MEGTTQKFSVVVVGGGTAGITTLARLKRLDPKVDVALVEPSTKHYYQPLWTLVGAGVTKKETTERAESSVIPRGVTWIQERVTQFLPEENVVVTEGGRRIGYAQLIVCPGIQLRWDLVKNLRESLGHGGVCSNYSYDHVDYTWQAIRSFRGGTAIFTHPNTPVKCGGAPQKIMYLAEHYFRKAGVRRDAKICFVSGQPTLFTVKKYADAIRRVVERRSIEVVLERNLVEIKPAERRAVFEAADGTRTEMAYDLLHVSPPMAAPDFIRTSPLANAAGWVDVDKHTLQHVRYPNIFSLGDASALPTSKTGAAVRKQAPVVARNVLSALAGRPLTQRYDGYTSCPLVTGYGRLILAEFTYDGVLAETFPFDQSKERRSMYLLKKYLLPLLYWRGMMRGRA